MTEEYLTAYDAEYTLTVHKSVFAAYLYHAESAVEAAEKLKALKKLHPSATHVCYAYALGEIGDTTRSSDDGEPSGTAGQPILSAVKAKKLTNVLIAVVRYFGGIKLGAGGLVRAYTAAAAGAADSASVKRFRLCRVFSGKTDYSHMEKFSAAAVKAPVKIYDLAYNELITFKLAVPAAEAEKILNLLNFAEILLESEGFGYFTDF